MPGLPSSKKWIRSSADPWFIIVAAASPAPHTTHCLHHLRTSLIATVSEDDKMLHAPAADSMLSVPLMGRGAASRLVYTGDEAAVEIRSLLRAVVSPIKHAF